MKKLLFYILFSNGLLAQIQQTNNGSLNELTFFVSANNKQYSDAEGSRFLNEEFVPCEIVGFGETKFVRFNVVENVIEIKSGDGKVMTLSFNKYFDLKLLDGSNKEYVVRSYVNDKGKEDISFFEKVFQNNNIIIFLKENIRYMPAKPAKSSYERAVSSKFIQGNDVHYYSLNEPSNFLIKQIPIKKKLFFEMFGEQSKSVEKFVKKEKLKLDKIDDLVRIMSEYSM
ncbi:MAG: hypothetical protein WBB24_11660 [Maribacter sp.]